MKQFIRKILRESLLPEAEIAQHTFDRIKDRIDIMSDDDLPIHYRETILDNFHKVKDTDFPKKKSYAVLLGQFKPNPKSDFYYYDEKIGREYYRVLNDPVLKDSTGNQFWLIIRNNTVTTFMLRKEWQTKPAELNAEKLRVDISIANMDKFIADMEKSRRQVVRQDPIVIINGVKWMVNASDETIFKKNKPAVKHKIEDILDDLDEPTQEKILSFL